MRERIHHEFGHDQGETLTQDAGQQRPEHADEKLVTIGPRAPATTRAPRGTHLVTWTLATWTLATWTLATWTLANRGRAKASHIDNT